MRCVEQQQKFTFLCISFWHTLFYLRRLLGFLRSHAFCNPCSWNRPIQFIFCHTIIIPWYLG
jgi:hypothetical protein